MNLKAVWIPHFLFRLYWRVVKPTTRGVKGLVFDESGNILLVRHSYGQTSMWMLPGGGVKKEESPEVAIKRELEEELELSGFDICKLFQEYSSNSEGKKDIVFVFEVVTSAAVGQLSRELAEAAFFPANQLPENISPATKRRMKEFKTGIVPSSEW